MSPTFPRSLDWMREGTDGLLATVDHLCDDELAAPSALPGWSRRHVLAHVGFNAAALRRLASWARTGTPSPMYASKEQRAEEIRDGSCWPAGRLRQLLHDGATSLADDLAALTPQEWSREVVTAQGRTVPATEIPWLRTREVVVHAVDLAAGVDFRDLPVDLCEALVGDIAVLRSARGDGPALALASPSGSTWAVTGAGAATAVSGEPPELVGWLTGRRGPDRIRLGHGHPVPVLGPWL